MAIGDRYQSILKAVEPPDLDAVVRINEKHSGQTRQEYRQRRLEISVLRPPWISLVAETDGCLAGFLFGWVGESEFGFTEPTGWVDLIGVDLPYCGRGVGHALFQKFLDCGSELQAIGKVATLIDLGQVDIRKFFCAAGLPPRADAPNGAGRLTWALPWAVPTRRT